jgi:molybdopterin-guanine dinucleotide biosynthesis protein A
LQSSIFNYQSSIFNPPMPLRFLNLSGFVLTGGESRRMGRPKAELALRGETMLARQIRLLQETCRSVTVIGRGREIPGLEVPAWPDAIPGRGPAGGIYTALLHARTEFNLIVGCDLPFVDARFLRFLAQRALDEGADVTVPEAREFRIQPVCAVYRRRALAVVRSRLDAGLNKTQDLIDRLPSQVISWREIARAGFPSRILANMNTPEEYEAAKQIVNSE